MKKHPPDVHGGNYYMRRGPFSPHEEVAPTVPDYVVCRRVVDFAPAPVPDGAEFTPCTDCNALVAYNPKGPFQSVPKVCMQCARIRPLPIP